MAANDRSLTLDERKRELTVLKAKDPAAYRVARREFNKEFYGTNIPTTDQKAAVEAASQSAKRQASGVAAGYVPESAKPQLTPEEQKKARMDYYARVQGRANQKTPATAPVSRDADGNGVPDLVQAGGPPTAVKPPAVREPVSLIDGVPAGRALSDMRIKAQQDYAAGKGPEPFAPSASERQYAASELLKNKAEEERRKRERLVTPSAATPSAATPPATTPPSTTSTSTTPTEKPTVGASPANTPKSPLMTEWERPTTQPSESGMSFGIGGTPTASAAKAGQRFFNVMAADLYKQGGTKLAEGEAAINRSLQMTEQARAADEAARLNRISLARQGIASRGELASSVEGAKEILGGRLASATKVAEEATPALKESAKLIKSSNRLAKVGLGLGKIGKVAGAVAPVIDIYQGGRMLTDDEYKRAAMDEQIARMEEGGLTGAAKVIGSSLLSPARDLPAAVGAATEVYTGSNVGGSRGSLAQEAESELAAAKYAKQLSERRLNQLRSEAFKMSSAKTYDEFGKLSPAEKAALFRKAAEQLRRNKKPQ